MSPELTLTINELGCFLYIPTGTWIPEESVPPKHNAAHVPLILEPVAGKKQSHKPPNASHQTQ